LIKKGLAICAKTKAIGVNREILSRTEILGFLDYI
jgi:hypothetical protein